MASSITNNKEFYEAAAVALDQVDDIDQLIQNSSDDIISFSFEGNEYTIDLSEFGTHRHYESYWWYFQFDENDDFVIFLEGFYDSWNGTEVEDPEILVGKKRIVTDFVIDAL